MLEVLPALKRRKKTKSERVGEVPYVQYLHFLQSGLCISVWLYLYIPIRV